MSSTAVQFYGLEAVVQAYMNNRVPAFAICAGKLLQFTYDGTDPQEEYREPNMREGSQQLLYYLSTMYQYSSAVYTLKTYSDLKHGEKIRPSTEYSTAINFKLTMPQNDNSMIPFMHNGKPNANMYMMDAIDKINQRFDLIEAKISGKKEDEDDEDETLDEFMIGMLKDPMKIKDYIDAIKGIAGYGGSSTAAIGKVRNVKRASNNEEDSENEQQKGTEYTEETQARLEKALNKLGEKDPNIIDHLETLANIPDDQFLKLVSMLKLYKR